MKEMNYTSWGITNAAKCKPPGNEFPGNDAIGEFCKKGLLEDLKRARKIVVPLGSTALQAITGMDVGITSIQGRLFSSQGHVILPRLLLA
jgi:uracil-DNA glycosylase family 4